MLFERGGGRQGRYVVKRDRGEVERCKYTSRQTTRILAPIVDKHQGSRMTSDLKGKAVLITGASTGIGAAAARAFAREGSRVAVHYNSSRDAAEKVATDVRALGGGAVFVRGGEAGGGGLQRLLAPNPRTVRANSGMHNNARG